MSDYLAHYGRSINDGAPGVGTGNWRRGGGLKTYRENRIRGLQSKQTKLSNKAGQLSDKKLKPLNDKIGKRQDKISKDLRKSSRAFTKGGRKRAGKRVEKNLAKNQDPVLKAAIVRANIAQLDAKRAVLNAKEQKRVAQYIRRYGRESLTEAGITPSKLYHSAYLAHYGRSINDGAPGVGTGNWRRAGAVIRSSVGKVSKAAKTTAGKIQNAKYTAQTRRIAKLEKDKEYTVKKAKEKELKNEIKALKKGKVKVPNEKTASELSNEELQAKITRAKLETEYARTMKQLKAETTPPKTFIQDLNESILRDIGKTAVRKGGDFVDAYLRTKVGIPLNGGKKKDNNAQNNQQQKQNKQNNQQQNQNKQNNQQSNASNKQKEPKERTVERKAEHPEKKTETKALAPTKKKKNISIG